jgi:membrane-bound ClpP family serine protease
LAQFPRTSDLPRQSPKYWAKEKDRYIRQLLISDIEAETKRPLFVYFSQLDQEINHTDPDDISEIIQGLPGRSADFLIQTPGGNVDATETIIALLRQTLDDYRVIVPSWAKSAGTVIALSSSKIIFGINSELGPIDPHWRTGTGMWPCELIAKDPAIPQHMRDAAKLAADRMGVLANDILARGMMKSKTDAERDGVIKKISSSAGYMSHGAVIDFEEASQLGLDVEFLPPDSDLWKRIWLLYCLYDFDTKAAKIGKVFEGAKFSISRPK